MASTRRLAAILAADVAGYSRLMGVDEEGTHERLKAHFQQLVEPKIKEYQGRIVKNTGDGVLAEFPSVVDAVRCAAEAQRGMIDRNAEQPDERRIEFRIGINLGDVIADSGDIFGDGVNIAARLQALAEPGGICISRTVRDQIRDRLPYQLQDLGEQSVKNIARPVRVYALRSDAIAQLVATSVPPAAVSQSVVLPRLSIVVLPFWQPGPAVQNNIAIFNVPGVAATVAGIARVLAPFPEARLAVVEYLRTQPAAPPMIEVQGAGAD
jgi:adenylate cyclase